MRVYRTRKGIILEFQGNYYVSRHTDWDVFVNRPNLCFEVRREVQKLNPDYDYKQYIQEELLPPVMGQEVWWKSDDHTPAAFQAMPHRVLTHRQELRQLREAQLAHYQPCIAAFINKAGEQCGYSLGCRMVSEIKVSGGQAKKVSQYDHNTALGPCLYLPDEPLPANTFARVEVLRESQNHFLQQTELVTHLNAVKTEIQHLTRLFSFENGFYLLLPLIFKQEIPPLTGAAHETKLTNKSIGNLFLTLVQK